MAYNFSKKFEEKAKEIEEWLLREFSSLRTGRATPAILDGVMVEAYGSKMPVKQVASIGIEDPKTLRVSPFDISQIKAIEKAIALANLGLSSSVDEKGLRISFPDLSEERRKAMIKISSEKLEQAKISVRKVRDEIMAEINEKEKKKEIGEDEKFRLKDDLQKKVDDLNKKLNDFGSKKEKEIMN